MFSKWFPGKQQYATAQPPPPASDMGGMAGNWRDQPRQTGMLVGASVRPQGDNYAMQQYNSTSEGMMRPGGTSTIYGQRPQYRPSGGWAMRRYTDVYAGVIFNMLLFFVIIGSIVTFAQYERHYDTYKRRDFQWNTPTCTVAEYREWKNIVAASTPPTTPNEPVSRVESRLARDRGVRTALRAWVPVSLLVSIMLGLGFIAAYRKFASFMITFGLFFCLLWAITFMVVNFVWGNWPLGLITIFIILAVIIAMLLCFKYREVIATLFEVAGQGLGDNPALILAVLALFVGTFLLFVMFAYGIYYALRFGQVSKNPAVQNINRNNFNNGIQSEVCQSFTGSYVRCCRWNTSPWAGVYGVFVIVNFAWMLLVLFEMKLFIVGGVLTRWYTDSSEYWKGQRTRVLLEMMMHAVSSNFGSIAMAGLLLWPLRLFRQCVSILHAICHCDCFCYEALQRFTRFVPIYMAHTGASFCTAAGMLSDQTNHFTFNLGAWWVPQMVLWSSSILIALGYAAVPYAITYSSYRQVSQLLKADLLRLAWAVGWTSFALALVMLVFISTLMIDTINSVFICYILDLTNPSRPQRPDVHAIFNQITDRMSQLGHNMSYVGVGRVNTNYDTYGADTRPIDDRLNTTYPSQNYAAPVGYTSTYPPIPQTYNNANPYNSYPGPGAGGASVYRQGYSLGPNYNRPGYDDRYGATRMSAPGGYPMQQGPGSYVGGPAARYGPPTQNQYPPTGQSQYPQINYPANTQPGQMMRPGPTSFGGGPGGQYAAGGPAPVPMMGPGGAQVLNVEHNAAFRNELQQVQSRPYAVGGGPARSMGGPGAPPPMRMDGPGAGYNDLGTVRNTAVRPPGGEISMMPPSRPGNMMPPGAPY